MATPTALYVLVSNLISVVTEVLCELFELDFLTAGFRNERRRLQTMQYSQTCESEFSVLSATV